MECRYAVYLSTDNDCRLTGCCSGPELYAAGDESRDESSHEPRNKHEPRNEYEPGNEPRDVSRCGERRNTHPSTPSGSPRYCLPRSWPKYGQRARRSRWIYGSWTRCEPLRPHCICLCPSDDALRIPFFRWCTFARSLDVAVAT
jgi:hypothetical protein